MAAQLKKAVLNPDDVDAEQLLPYLSDSLLYLVARSHERIIDPGSRMHRVGRSGAVFILFGERPVYPKSHSLMQVSRRDDYARLVPLPDYSFDCVYTFWDRHREYVRAGLDRFITPGLFRPM